MRRITAELMAGLLLILALGGYTHEDYVKSQIPAADRALAMRFMRTLATEDATKIEAVAGGKVDVSDYKGGEISDYNDLYPADGQFHIVRHVLTERDGYYLRDVQVLVDGEREDVKFQVWIKGPMPGHAGKPEVFALDRAEDDYRELLRDNDRKFKFEASGLLLIIGFALMLGPVSWVTRWRRKRARGAEDVAHLTTAAYEAAV